MSKEEVFVHTTSEEKHEISSSLMEIIISLYQKSIKE